jgi:hypothetical protein
MARKKRLKRVGKPKVRSKKTKYNGIEFKSQLEVDMYQALESIGLKPKYEPQHFCVSDGFVYHGEFYKNTKGRKDVHLGQKLIQPITYTPDFVDHDLKFIIETKGQPNESFPLRWKLFMKYMNENGMGDYSLYIPRNKHQVNQTASIIKSKLQ